MKEKKSIFTSSKVPLKEFYSATDAPEISNESPGAFPFTRGIRDNMYRGRLWTMRQYAGFGTAAESNLRYKKLLSEGSTGLSVAFDLPTQMGLDADHPMSRGEVGRSGVAINTLTDMSALLAEIPLEKVSVSMTINATAPLLLAFYLSLARQNNILWRDLRGTIQNDLLKEYMARGTYIYPVKASLRLITDVFSFCCEQVPQFNTISISGYHIREAGATAVQELAFTLANGLTYVEQALQVGLKVNDFAPRLSFFFNGHNHFFEEVAKFRAARKLWATLLRQRYKANDEACRLRFHTQTAGSTLTAQEPQNNVVRVAYQALAAVLGGTQSLHTNAMDEALALPTEESVALAVKTQQILAYETGVADVADPLAGSYYLETLTQNLFDRALAQINAIEAKGGVMNLIQEGYFAQQIQDSAYAQQLNIENKTTKIVGVNAFCSTSTTKRTLHKIEPQVEQNQIRSLQAYKKSRDETATHQALNQLKEVAKSTQNIMPALLAAVDAKATLGEMSSALEQIFGRYQAP